MRHFIAPVFVLGLFVSGCYDSHGRFVSVIPTGDAGPVIGGDAGPMVVVPDSGPIVTADAGSDAFVPPMPDAGSDAGPMVEPDAGPHVCPDSLPNYVINLAATPLSSSVTAGETGVPSVGITLTTPVDSGLTYTMFNVLGRGDTDGTFRAEHFRDVVTFCTLFEEDVPLGAGAPDERGFITIGAFSHHLDVGRSANIRIECGTDTDVAQPTGDRYVVALNGLVRGVEPVTATDDLGCERTAVWGRSLLNQVESAEPSVVVTVNAVIPDFVIEAFEMTESAMLIPGPEFAMGYGLAGYRIGPDESLASVILNLDGDVADVRSVSVWSGRSFLGWGNFPSGVGSSLRIEFTEPFVTPVDDYGYITVAVGIPYAVPGASVSGATEGATRSGDSFCIGIHAVERYVGGTVESVSFDPIMSNEFVIRMSVPTMTMPAPSSTSIANGARQQIVSWQIGAHSTGILSRDLIGVSRVGLTMTIDSAVGRVCSPRLLRGSTELVWGVDYRFRTRYGTDMDDPDRCWDASWGELIVGFIREERITGLGQTYTIVGTPEGFVAGDSITTSFARSHGVSTITGYLASYPYYDMVLDAMSPWGALPDSRPMGTQSADFIWSDLSEVPHNRTFGYLGGSRDFIGGYLVPGLDSPPTVLTR